MLEGLATLHLRVEYLLYVASLVGGNRFPIPCWYGSKLVTTRSPQVFSQLLFHLPGQLMLGSPHF